jgi:hypothetical protein
LKFGNLILKIRIHAPKVIGANAHFGGFKAFVFGANAHFGGFKAFVFGAKAFVFGASGGESSLEGLDLGGLGASGGESSLEGLDLGGLGASGGESSLEGLDLGGLGAKALVLGDRLVVRVVDHDDLDRCSSCSWHNRKRIKLYLGTPDFTVTSSS